MKLYWGDEVNDANRDDVLFSNVPGWARVTLVECYYTLCQDGDHPRWLLQTLDLCGGGEWNRARDRVMAEAAGRAQDQP